MKYVERLLIFSIFLIIEFFLIVGILYIKGPVLKTKNKEIIYIKYNEKYNIKPIKGTYLGKDISSDIMIDSNINFKKIGNYRIIYSLFINNREYKKIKYVNIIDSISPTIELKEEDKSYACPNKEYIESGYNVTDNIDDNLNDNVKIIKNKDKWLYLVTDTSGNVVVKERNIIYKDITNPQIILENDNVNIFINNKYEETKYKVTDNCDEIDNSLVKITSNVDTSKVGTYTVNYEVKDNAGNIGTAKRTVNVMNRPIFKDRTIYLTFDDGPSSNITPTILNILKEENVKATFFVNYTGLDNLIKREYNEGHSIGNHTASHNFSYIYSSTANYWNDYAKLNNYLYSLNGSVTNLIRFPGGSSNTVSRNYAYKIMTSLVNDANNKGLIYVDWTIDSNDAGGTNTSAGVYNNVVNHLKPNGVNVVLMHDASNKYATMNALRDIIRYGKDNGYTFARIDGSTPYAHHHINN